MLSLIPFTTAWMGENHFAQNPVALYGINLLLCAVAYAFLMKAILKNEGKDSKIGTAVVNTKKENLSIILYLAGIIISFFTPIISVGILFIVAIIWIVPDTRIEKNLKP